jgi:hypothetical protein
MSSYSLFVTFKTRLLKNRLIPLLHIESIDDQCTYIAREGARPSDRGSD